MVLMWWKCTAPKCPGKARYQTFKAATDKQKKTNYIFVKIHKDSRIMLKKKLIMTIIPSKATEGWNENSEQEKKESNGMKQKWKGLSKHRMADKWSW